MALMSQADSTAVKQWCYRHSTNATMSKANWDAAVDATDAWIDGNAAASSTNTGYNSALPLPARTSLNTAEKTQLFCQIARQRAGLVL